MVYEGLTSFVEAVPEDFDLVTVDIECVMHGAVPAGRGLPIIRSCHFRHRKAVSTQRASPKISLGLTACPRCRRKLDKRVVPC